MMLRQLYLVKLKLVLALQTKRFNSHGSPLGEDEISLTRKLEWNFSPFEIPDDLLREWRSFYKKMKNSKKIMVVKKQS